MVLSTFTFLQIVAEATRVDRTFLRRCLVRYLRHFPRREVGDSQSGVEGMFHLQISLFCDISFDVD